MNGIRYYTTYFRDMFDSGWRLGLYRLRYQFKKKVWLKKLRPICWVIGHSPYEDNSWSYSSTKCFRCRKILKYKRHGS